MTYPGGKAQPGVYQTLINQIPPHDTFLSCFLGDCAVLLHKRPARQSIGIDLNPVALLKWHARNFPGLRLIQTDALSFLNHYFALETYPRQPNYPEKPRREFVYCDPPYPHSTRTKPNTYAHELTDNQHLALLGILTRINAPVMISTYPNELYNDTLHGWRYITYQAMTRGGSHRTEQVFMNYPPPLALHDYAHTGKNKHQRERVRRRRRNWLRVLQALPPFERGAVLQAIAPLYTDQDGPVLFRPLDATPGTNAIQTCRNIDQASGLNYAELWARFKEVCALLDQLTAR